MRPFILILLRFRDASHYGHPSREAVGLLGVQRSGLQIANKIYELEPSAKHNVNPPKAKPKVQTFGHELPRPLDLDGHNVKPPKAKAKLQRKKVYPTLSLA
jgi:hypothetical protein